MELIETIKSKGIDYVKNELNIIVKTHPQFPNLYQFTYNVDVDFSLPEVQQARGIILDADNDFKPVAYPFDKFFNYGEPLAANLSGKVDVLPKYDGSMLVLYFYGGYMQVATRGTPDASALMDDGKTTFRQMFLKIFKEYRYLAPKEQDRTFIFELVSPLNRIVVPYKKPQLILIGVRNNNTLEEEDPQYYARKYAYRYAEPIAVPEVGSNDELLEYLKREVETFNIATGEGFIVRDEHYNRLKIKSPAYVRAHHIKGRVSSKNILNIILNNESTELLTYFPEYQILFDYVNSRIENFAEQTKTLVNVVQKYPIEQVAEVLKYQGKSDYSGVVFSLIRNKVNEPLEYLNKIPLKRAHQLLRIDEDVFNELKIEGVTNAQI